jgi:hypothetical protein
MRRSNAHPRPATAAPRQARKRETWRLALNLSIAAAAGGILFVLVGAWLAAWITFALGACCAGVAGMLLRRDERSARAPAASSRSRPIRRRRA